MQLEANTSRQALLSNLALAVLGLVAYWLFGRIYDYWRLRHFRGPPTSGFLWWWHTRSVIGGKAHEFYGRVSEKYGTIARIAPNHLITSDSEFWARINSVRSSYERSPWYYHAARLEPRKDNVFTECDTARHELRRKRMAAGYSGKENPTLEPTIDLHVMELVNLVRSYASTKDSNHPSRPMDLSQKIPYFTLDVISHLSLGQGFGNLVADQDQNEYLKSSEEGLRIGNTAFALGVGWMKDHPIIGPLISPSEKDMTGFGRMMHEGRKLIEIRRVQPVDIKSDMIASFIRNGVQGEDLFQEVFEQIIAGSDTTAAALRGILLYVISHPRVYAKLRAEIDQAVADGIAPSGSAITPDRELRQLPYLGAVIREGMRVHPPVANLFSRVVPPSGDVVTVDGVEKFIPGGTLIGYSAWSMHRNNRALYGPDAEVFRPERWLTPVHNEADKDRLAQMTRTNDMIFGHGRWSCLGRNVALIEIHKVIFELFRHFDFALTNPSTPWKVFNSLGLFEISEMWVDVALRN